MEKLLTVQEVADVLNCHPQTIYRNKELPRVSIPGIGIRFKEKELNKYLEQRIIKTISLLNLPTLKSFKLTNLEEYDKIYLRKMKGGNGGSMNRKKIRWNYGFGSVYIRKTEQGKDRWYVDYWSEGKRIREVINNAQDRADAVLHLQERVAESFNQAHNLNKNRLITFTELTNLYLEDYAKLNKKSWKDDKYRVNAHLKPFFGDKNLNEITPLLIEKYRALRLKTGVTKSTVNREITIMKKMFNLAIDWNLTDRNPVLKVKLFSEKDTMKERILTEEEEAKLLAISPDYLNHIVVVALNTGMRRSEILNLTWRQVDLSKRLIRVEHTKSGKNRTIPVNYYLHQELLKIEKQNRKSEFVFPNPKTGQPFNEIKKSFKNACRKAEIDNLRFHDLRHTFATRLIESGVDLITVRDLLGHFSVRVTQRYTHSNQNQKKEAVDLLAKKTLKKVENSEKLAHICHIDVKEKNDISVNRLFLMN